MRVPQQAFTAKADAIANILHSPAVVRAAFDPAALFKPGSSARLPDPCEVKAIWDTGANGSVITSKVVDVCGLKQIGLRRVLGVHGEATTKVFLVALEIHPQLGFPAVAVTLGDLGGEFDLLIGMDIINRGDFAVSNFEGKTAFTFRHPSSEFIDFAAKSGQTPVRVSAGRNSPCPCGSGKKYKRCHGVPGSPTLPAV